MDNEYLLMFGEVQDEKFFFPHIFMAVLLQSEQSL